MLAVNIVLTFSTVLASKSEIFTRLSAITRRLSGLMSPWTTPWGEKSSPISTVAGAKTQQDQAQPRRMNKG